jgi:hypothetical protein
MPGKIINKEGNILKSGKPFFSIVVPTRNRPEYVVDAVTSVLAQSFVDLEVIVSDNSNEAEASKNVEALSAALTDARCRYVRPPQDFSMVDHWEWALSHATGNYIGIVTDRMALRLYALEEIAGIATEFHPSAICYLPENAGEFPNYRSIKANGRKPRPRIVASDDKVREFSTGKIAKDTPRLLNSFVRADALALMRDADGKLLGGVSPDYFFTFKFLGHFDKYVSIDHPLLIVQGEARSNGRAVTTGKTNRDSQDFMARLLNEQQEFLRYGPIPGDTKILNAGILREFEIVSGGLANKFPPIDHRSFYEHAVRYAIVQAKHNLLSDEVRRALADYRSAHQFEAILLPRNRKKGTLRKAILVLKGEAGPRHTMAAVLAVRRYIEKLMLAIGLGKRISATTLIEVLHRDNAIYHSQLRKQQSSSSEAKFRG